MIDKKNILEIFKELDQVMISENYEEDLFIFGSAALIFMGIANQERMTRDVDIVKPLLDDEMARVVVQVGKKFGLEAQWLNSAGGKIFVQDIPSGWEERVIKVYQGCSLRVFSLSRGDLICTKLDAYCDRQLMTYREDLLSLKPSFEEMEKAAAWIFSRGHLPKEVISDAKLEIKQIIRNKGGSFE